MIGKDVEGNHHSLILGSIPHIFVEGMRKTMKIAVFWVVKTSNPTRKTMSGISQESQASI